MPRTPDPCLRLVRESIEDFSAEDMAEIIEELRARQQVYLNQGLSGPDATRRAGAELSETLRIAARVERRNAAINRRVRLEAVENIRTVWRDDPAEGILSMLFGSPKAREGSRNSVHAAQSANFRRYMAGLEDDLERAGLFDVVRRREMDQEVGNALWRIDDDDALARFSPQATQIARILHKWRELARLEANRAGAWIGELQNYIVRQTHDADKLLREGFEAWRDFIKPRLDVTRMFQDETPPADLDAWLNEAFNNLTSGIHPRSPTDATAARMSAFQGPGNLAKRLSRDRIFHFMDADKWYEYNQRFGSGTLIETYINDLHRRAESTGLMQILGTNPEYNLDAIVKAIRTELSRTDVKALKKFDQSTRRGRRIDNAFLEVSGFTRTIAASNLAVVGAVGRVFNTVTSLGFSMLSSMTDVHFRAATMRYQGMSYLKQLQVGMVAPLKRIFGALGSQERQSAIRAAGYFNDIWMRNLLSRFSPDENVSGKVHRAAHTYFKWNLLGPWTDEGRRSSIEAMANFLGDQHERTWAQLGERVQRSLARYGLTEENWDLVRRGVNVTDDGTFLTPAAIRELPAGDFAEIAKPQIEAAQRGLLERVKKRLRADAREQQWIDNRHSRFTEALEEANERLLDWAQRRENRFVTAQELASGKVNRELGRGEAQAGRAESQARYTLVEKILQLNKSLAEMRVELDDLSDWWRMNFDMDLAPEYGKRLIRWAGNREGALRVRKAQAEAGFRRAKTEFKTRMSKIETEIAELRTALDARLAEQLEELGEEYRTSVTNRYEEFNARWKERYAELQEYMTHLTDRMEARKKDTGLDLQSLEGQVQRILDNTRTEVANRLQRFYADEVDSAIISPDARAMALVRQGTQLGTPMGEILRLFWQFKTFAIGVVQRGLMRELYGYDLGRGGRFGLSEIRGLALLMVGSLASGYMAMTLKDLLRGRTPRPIDKASTWATAMVQGGALGVYGDFLLGTQHRFGGGFLSALGGPTVGKLDQAYKIYGAVRSGDDVRAQALRFAINNVPYNNLFYTKAALDYLFLYELMEAMNPGYLRRYEDRITEETGAEWWLPPSETLQ